MAIKTNKKIGNTELDTYTIPGKLEGLNLQTGSFNTRMFEFDSGETRENDINDKFPDKNHDLVMDADDLTTIKDILYSYINAMEEYKGLEEC